MNTQNINLTNVDEFEIGGKKLDSRLLIGTAMYDSPSIMQASIHESSAQIVTVSLRRQFASNVANNEAQDNPVFWQFLQDFTQEKRYLLPNTAGCFSAKEAIVTAQMARELFKTNWVKLEVIGDDYTLQPDPFQLVEAAQELVSQGFEVFPYCTDDLILCEKLLEVGCNILMPWGAPIGTGKGLMNPYALTLLRNRFPHVPMIIDAGLGKPSHAAQAMEMGFDGVLLNTAVAKAQDSIAMAKAFKLAVDAGRLAYKAGCMQEQQKAVASTPVLGMPFWHNDN
ncbi:MAG: thiazole synthase [Bermanella sp.]|nr:thiazole synthase [Bermanella sp.]|tara:strand:+ start:482 stop:1327 length:846 start_codon:yes stop_codon:yes gene_type:complete